MKKALLAGGFLVCFATLVFSQSVYRLIADYKQNTDYIKKYKAIEKLCKMKYVPMLNEFVNKLLEEEERGTGRDGRKQQIKITIAKNIKFYKGVEFSKIREQILLLIRFISALNDIELAGELTESLGHLLKTAEDLQKRLFVKIVRNKVMEIRRDANTSSKIRNREYSFVYKTVYGLKELNTNDAKELLTVMLSLGYSRTVTAFIEKTIRAMN
jgi:hypothetical protein